MIIESYDTVWDALVDMSAEAANLTARADLLLAVREGEGMGRTTGSHRQAL